MEPSQSSAAAVSLDETTSLPDLVLTLSWLLFDRINAESEWLAKPNVEWERHESHLKRKAFVNSLTSCKDTAENGISMHKSFALSVRGHQQFQWLLQAVEQHKHKVPRLTKSALSKE